MPKYNRKLSDFNGDAVVIGCSHLHSRCEKSLHLSQDDFYCIDIAQDEKPDAVLDITKELPLEFSGRFTLTLAERIPFFAYNKIKENKMGEKGFENLLRMTADDGFILIVGCPAKKGHREQIYSKDIKYIELNNETVLIPKNQDASISDLEKQINSLPSLKKTIEIIKNRGDNYDFKFCTTEYEKLTTIVRNSTPDDTFNSNGKEEALIHDSNNDEGEKESVENFKGIYNGLYAGQSSWLKQKNFPIGKHQLTQLDIEKYILKNPKNRSAKRRRF